VNTLEAKGRSSVEDDDFGLLAQLQKRVEVDEAAGAVSLDFGNQTLEIIEADFGLRISYLLRKPCFRRRKHQRYCHKS
jgi:hypothetical protein